MIKRILSIVLVLCIVSGLSIISPINAGAAKDGIYSYTVTNGYATITDVSESATGAVSVPQRLGGYPVRAIGDKAFQYCTSLREITIPDSVTSIGNYAFYECTSLTEITIPDSVTSIGNYAFYECTSLTEITIPNSVTSIGHSAFSSCTSLREITIPDSVTSIGAYAFYYCTSLTEITIPDSVTSIGHFAFQNCTSLREITIPEAVTSIGYFAFQNCTSLRKITIPESVTSIGNVAFSHCTSLTEITIPEAVTSIGNSTFSSCTSLRQITIPESVTSIGSSAFEDCKSLTEITIPEGVTSIGNVAFSNCNSLREINVNSKNTEYCDIDGNLFNKNKTQLLQYAIGKNDLSYTIPEGVTSIGDSAFSSCTSLAEITIPESVTSIGDSAFSSCTSLRQITIPESVTSIGDYVFRACTNLREITIPEGVTSIGNYVFQACTNLREITIPEGVTSIGNVAFSSCTSLAEITIPESVTSIGDSAFSSCTSLRQITIPENVTSISSFAFSSCTSLRQITIPESVTSIGDNVFQACTNLREITIPENVTSIGRSAFYNCKNLTEITIPENVTSIGYYAFSGCSSLTEIIIPESVTEIGSRAFYKCTNLTDVYYPGSEEQWNSIRIGSLNESLTNATIHYNCYDFKYTQETVSGANDISGYDDFEAKALRKHIIPALNQNMVPQGIAYRRDKNQIYITSYSGEKESEDKENSVLMVLDADSGSYIGEYYLYKTNGDAFKGHAGGIAVSDKNIYIANGQNVSRISLDTIDSTKFRGNLKFEEDIDLALHDANISFCDYSDGMLWVGNFYSDKKDDYDKYAHESYKTLILGYKLDSTTENGFNLSKSTWKTDDYDYVPDIACRVNWDEIQGVTTVGKDKIILSHSYGRGKAGTLYICKYPKALNASNVLTLDSGRQVPLVTLDDVEQMETIPMIEDLTNYKDTVLASFESGARKYKWFGSDKTDSYWQIPIGITVGEEYPVIVLPGIMGSTLKGNMIPTLPEKIPVSQNNLQIVNSVAGFLNTGASDMIKTLKNDGNKVYECPYDWRLSIDRIEKEYLRPVIQKAKRATGKDKVIIIAHSMGGLVARSYIQSDSYENDIDSLYMLGTPNMGSTQIISLAQHGVPFNIQHYLVLKANYNMMTGEDFSDASKAEIKDFVNKRIIGATQLLPSYDYQYYDTAAQEYFKGFDNTFLQNLNNSAVSSGRYQKINGSNPNKVKTLLIASNKEANTPFVITVKNRNFSKFTTGFIPTWGSPGDGTVTESSAYVSDMRGFKDIWTMISGEHGGHMELMGELDETLREYLKSNTQTQKPELYATRMSLFSLADTDETTKPQIQINLTGCKNAMLVTPDNEIEIFDGYSLENIEDGSYSLTIEKANDCERMSVQFTYPDGLDICQKLYSFLDESNNISFSVNGEEITFEEKCVKALRSLNDNGYVKLVWDKADGASSYNIYKKLYSEDTFTYIGETDSCEYSINDTWLNEFSEECIKYYVIPVYETGTTGAYNTSASNYNNTVASFEYVINDDNSATFTDTSQGEITSWEWDFDTDGIVDSTEQNPVFTYTNSGVYDVTLTVSGPTGTSRVTYDDIVKIGTYIEKLDVQTENTLMLGSSANIIINATMSDGSVSNVSEKAICYSSNENVISVDGNAIYANEIGNAVLTVDVDGVSAIVNISVINDEANVTVNLSGNGNADGSGTYFIGEKITLWAVPFDGEEFLGWYLDDILVCENEDYSFEVTGAAALTAKFTKNTYGVSFYDGEALISTVRVPKGGALSLPEPPEKHGYSFIEFYTDDGRVTNETVYNSDTEVFTRYAEWKYTDEFIWYINTDEKAVIIEYTGSQNEVWIPAAIEGYDVTEIGESVFAYMENTEEVYIPDTVTKIKANAFPATLNKLYYSGDENKWNCIDIDSDNSILNNVEKIYNYTDNIVSGKLYVKNSDNNLLNINLELDRIYKDCLAEISIYDESGNIVKTTIQNLTKATNVYDFNVPFTGDDLTYTVKIEFISDTEERTIYGASNEDTFVAYITIYSDEKFEYIEYKNGIKIVNYKGTDVAVEIPEQINDKTVIAIGEDAFSYEKIERLVLNESLSEIADYAFMGNKLTTVTIPKNIVKIGKGAFSFNKNLQDVTVDTENTQYCSINGALFDKEKTTLLQYPVGKELYVYKMPETVEIIQSDAFTHSSITQIILSEALSNVESYAFYACNDLQAVLYTGTEEQFSNINIDTGNDSLDYAKYTYSYDNTLLSMDFSQYRFEYDKIVTDVNFNYLLTPAVIVLAIYDEQNNLITLKTTNADSDNIQYSIKMDIGTDYHTIKVFCWDTINSLKPLTNPITPVPES